MNQVEFRLSKFMVLVPIVVFLFFSVYLFVFKQAFDMNGLAMAAFIGISAGAIFAKSWDKYWSAVIHGMASELSGTVVSVLLMAGIFSAMMKTSGIADGLIWFGSTMGITGSLFCVFTFIASLIIATTTGTSIGTIFATVPIFYSAGLTLGADPSMLAGAILSGAIFGDALAPVSDVTIISASTQKFRKREGVADIGGVVRSRLVYSVTAAVLVVPFYLIAGGASSAMHFEAMGDPRGLIMLIPAVVLILIVILYKNIFAALFAGIVAGSVLGLLTGQFGAGAILSTSGGNINGFIYNGISSMAGTILLVLSMFGIVGVLEKCGGVAAMISYLRKSRFSSSVRGTELVMGLGSMLISLAFASVTSAALIMFGPIGDEVGAEKNIHPYRRSNIMSGMANSIPVVLPFSAFVFITLGAVKDPAVTPFTLFYSTAYPWALFIVYMFAMITGAGRRFEGQGGVEVKEEATLTPKEAANG